MPRPRASALYMYPEAARRAKKLYFDVIPRAVDEYYTFLAAYPRRTGRSGSAIRSGTCMTAIRPSIELPVPFALLLNLVSASNAQNKDVLWGFISRYAPGVDAGDPSRARPAGRLCDPLFRGLREARQESIARPTRSNGRRWQARRQALAALPADADGEAIQNAALNVARTDRALQDHDKQSPEGGPGVSVAFFQMIYQVLIGQERGPRFGSFVALYGIAETRALIERALSGRTGGLNDRDSGVRGGGPKMPLPPPPALLAGLGIGSVAGGPGPAILDQPRPEILGADPAVGPQVAWLGSIGSAQIDRAAPQQKPEGGAGTQPARPVGAAVAAHLVRLMACGAGERDGIAPRLDGACRGRHRR